MRLCAILKTCGLYPEDDELLMNFKQQGTPRSFWWVGKRASRKTRLEGRGTDGPNQLWRQ